MNGYWRKKWTFTLMFIHDMSYAMVNIKESVFLACFLNCTKGGGNFLWHHTGGVVFQFLTMSDKGGEGSIFGTNWLTSYVNDPYGQQKQTIMPYKIWKTYQTTVISGGLKPNNEKNLG